MLLDLQIRVLPAGLRAESPGEENAYRPNLLLVGKLLTLTLQVTALCCTPRRRT